MIDREKLLRLLEKEKVAYTMEEHAPVFTMEEMRQLHLPHEKDVAVNLFLRDDKKRNYYLVTMDGSAKTDLKAMRHILGSRPLSFASESDLKKILNLEKGHVTPFGILNDEEKKAEAVIDIRFMKTQTGVHPMENTATVFLDGSDLYSFLEKQGCRVRWADFTQVL
ncbi:MAG: prolyl-tRNA synthetase associated domain-containing protein [Solobacterium sp.]|nr:prolyl-tRNA synthetase associated domain-containing protein [Solobacterium sp.]